MYLYILRLIGAQIDSQAVFMGNVKPRERFLKLYIFILTYYIHTLYTYILNLNIVHSYLYYLTYS